MIICKTQVKCHICKGRLLNIFCQNVLRNNEPNKNESVSIQDSKTVQSTTNQLFSIVSNKTKTTYLQTVITFIEYNGKINKVRVLCDSGSQKSFISSHCVDGIGLKSDGNILIQQDIFGSKKTGSNHHKTHNISLKSLNFELKTNVHALNNKIFLTRVPKFSDISVMEKYIMFGLFNYF